VYEKVESRRSPLLSSIDLGRNNKGYIGDADFVVLATIMSHCLSLTIINLDQNNIDDEACADLAHVILHYPDTMIIATRVLKLLKLSAQFSLSNQRGRFKMEPRPSIFTTYQRLAGSNYASLLSAICIYIIYGWIVSDSDSDRGSLVRHLVRGFRIA